MSRIEVNEIAKTPTGTEVTLDSKLVLDDTIQLKNYTTSQVSAILNPADGQMVFNSETGTVQVYRELTSLWTDVGGTEHTQSFNTIIATGQPNITTTEQNDTLTFVAGSDITLTFNSANQSITIDHDGLDTSAVAQNIVADADSTRDLGTTDTRWANVYLDRIYIGNMDIQSINLGVNSDKLVVSDQVEVSGIIESSDTGGTGIPVEGGLNPDSIKTDSLSEKTSSANIDLENDLVLASGVTIDFTNGSATGLAGGGGGTNMNLLMNGAFQIWQYGTAGTQTSNGRPQSADRWVTTTNVSAITKATFAQGQTDVPNNPEYYARWNSSNTGTCIMEQRIEGVHTAQGQQVTYSFWARTASGTKTLDVQVTQQFGVAGGYSPAVTTAGSSHSIDTTWTQYSGTISVPSTSGKSLGTASNQAIHDCLKFQFKHSGSSFDIYLANIKLENGGSVTSFEIPHYNEEFTKCTRFFQKVGAGTNAIIGWGGGSRNNVFDGILPYKLGPMYRFPTKIHSGQYRFVRGIYNEYGNYLNHNFNSHTDDIGWGCWNVDIGNNLTSYFVTIAGGNSSMRWYWDAEIQ
jgi:hypothetical protein